MTVSVVIAAHRAEATLDATLASVAAQTLAPERVIVVDDASPDATAQVASAWADRLPLRVIALDRNGGPARARDVGIRDAGTELVALLDADDYWLPDHLEALHAQRGRAGGLVTADTLRWIPGRAVGRRTSGDQLPIPEPAAQLARLYLHNYVFMGTLFAADEYREIGGFRAEFRGTEDWDLWIRMVRAGMTVSRPAHPTVLYRLSSGSLSSRDVEQADAELAVLAAARQEAATDEERAAVDAGIRRVRARRALFAAYAAGAAGDPATARRLAAEGLRGGRRVAARSMAMLIAPRWGAAQRDALREQPRWWLRRP